MCDSETEIDAERRPGDRDVDLVEECVRVIDANVRETGVVEECDSANDEDDDGSATDGEALGVRRLWVHSVDDVIDEVNAIDDESDSVYVWHATDPVWCVYAPVGHGNERFSPGQ